MSENRIPEDKPISEESKNRAKAHSKKSFNYEALALKIMRRHGPFKSIGKDRWKWNGSIWAPTDFDRYRRLIVRLLPPSMEGHCLPVDNTIRMMNNLTQVDPDSEENKWKRPIRYYIGNNNGDCESIDISTQNVVIRIPLNGGEIKEIDPNPKEFVTAELPLTYNPKAECPIFDYVLKSVLPKEEDRCLLKCFVGYCLMPDHRFQTVLFCYGGPNSGKSLLIHHGIGSMFGSELMSGVTLEDICKGGDGLRSLESSLVNLATEINSYKLDDTSIFNQVACGESINKALKYQKDKKLTFNAKHIYVGNDLPKWKRGSKAQARRIIIIFFPNDFSKEAKDGKLEAGIKLEASGIFNWAIEGLVEISKLGKMPIGSEESQLYAEEFRVGNDPHGEFSGLFTEWKKDGRIAVDDYRKTFFYWCRSKDIEVRHDCKILWMLKKLNPHVRQFSTTEKGVRKRVYSGVRFNEKGENFYQIMKKEFVV